MKKLFLLWLLFGVVGIAFSQTVTIKNQQTNEFIELATLSSANTTLFATTNAQGQADISAFKDAERIEIRSLGFKTLIKSYAELEAAAFMIEMETSNLNLDEVVVSATRWRQSTNDIPSKVITISAEEVAFQNPQTAADLLGVSGKVFIQKSQQGGGSPMIRGFATTPKS